MLTRSKSFSLFINKRVTKVKVDLFVGNHIRKDTSPFCRLNYPLKLSVTPGGPE